MQVYKISKIRQTAVPYVKCHAERFSRINYFDIEIVGMAEYLPPLTHLSCPELKQLCNSCSNLLFKIDSF